MTLLLSCSSVAVALGGLTLWHAVLITRGETSVERHINHKETKRLREQGKVARQRRWLQRRRYTLDKVSSCRSLSRRCSGTRTTTDD